MTLTWPAVSDGGAPITSARIYPKERSPFDGTLSGTPTESFFNADINLATRTAIIPQCAQLAADGSAARYGYALAFTNLAGEGGFGTSNAVTPIDGPSSAHTISSIDFIDGNCVLNVTLPTRGGCGQAQLLCDYSTDSGLNWDAIPERSTSLTAYPTSPTGKYWNEYLGIGRVKQWILPPSASNFLVRTRLADASGTALSGSDYVTTSVITPSEPSDSRWSSVVYLWDATVRTEWTLQADGSHAIVTLPAGSPAGTGRFGALYSGNVNVPTSFANFFVAAPEADAALYATGGDTYEWWMKCPGDGTTITDPVLVLPVSNIATTKLFVFFRNGAVEIKRRDSTGTYLLLTLSTSTIQNQMAHFVVEGSTVSNYRIFVNGTYQRSASGSTTTLGSVYTDPIITAPVESVRVTRGARYRSRFLPPAATFWRPT